MAKLFDISIPEGASTLKLDSKGRGSVHYTVKSLTRTPIDAKGVLLPVPATPGDPNHPVTKGWVKIDGKCDRHFDVNGEDAFTVTVAVPPKTPAGTYSYRLDVVSAARPDEGDSSPVVNFKVEAAAPKPGPNWALIAAVIAIVVVVGGVLMWLLLGGSGVPDLKGKSLEDATAALAKAKVRLQQPVLTRLGAPGDADKVVDQSVPAGTKVGKDTAITLTVGAQVVTVPNIVGKTLADAQQTLAAAQLSLGTASNVPNPSYGPGVVWQQSPNEKISAQSNSAVNVVVTPQTVTVPVLTGVGLNDVITRVAGAQLVLAGYSGNDTSSNTTGQSIDANTQVPIGTQITVTFPSTVNCPPRGCFVTGMALHSVVNQKFAAIGPRAVSAPATAPR
jgi:beta-lactam-binding protein with PASTA domain